MARSKYEKKAQKELQAEGYLVDYKARVRMVSRGYMNDFLHAFDLLAYRPGELRWIAIKGREGVASELRRKIEAIEFPTGVTKEIWCYDQKDGRPRKEIL